jgi:hypothetical protein
MRRLRILCLVAVIFGSIGVLWASTSSAAPADTSVTAQPPTFNDDSCVDFAPSGASYTITATTGVDYFVDGVRTSAGTYPATDGSTVTVTAQPQAGFVLTGTTSFVHVFTATPTCAVPPTFSADSPPSGVVGDSYGYQFVATGQPLPSYSIVGGRLPDGLTLSSTGALTGVPSSAGAFPFVVEAANGASPAASAPITIRIASPLTITTPAALPAAQVGVAYRVRLAATGGTIDQPYVWSLAPGAILPPGLSFASDGTISGTPTEPGDYEVTAVVGDPRTRTFTIEVAAASPTTPLATTGTPTAALLELGIGLLAVGGLATTAARRRRA